MQYRRAIYPPPDDRLPILAVIFNEKDEVFLAAPVGSVEQGERVSATILSALEEVQMGGRSPNA